MSVIESHESIVERIRKRLVHFRGMTMKNASGTPYEDTLARRWDLIESVWGCEQDAEELTGLAENTRVPVLDTNLSLKSERIALLDALEREAHEEISSREPALATENAA